jgi:hypothetical protein
MIPRSRLLEGLQSIAEAGQPAYGVVRELDVGSREYIECFVDEAVFPVRAGASILRVFVGSYGSGKTHLLELVAGEAVNRGFAIVRADLSSGTGLDEWEQVVASVLAGMTLRRPDGRICRGMHEILQEVAAEQPGAAARLGHSRHPHEPLARAVSLLLRPEKLTEDAKDLLARYICGERVGAGLLSRAGIRGVRAPLSKRNAEPFLVSAARILADLGIPLAILFDESEKSLEASKSPRRSRRMLTAANVLRRLIDASANGSLRGVLCVFAVLPDFVDRASQAYAALGQRLSRPFTDGQTAPWRWPVVEVADVNVHATPTAFISAAVDAYAQVAGQLGIAGPGVRARLDNVATIAAGRQAGAGFRRDVMRALATDILVSLQRR